MMKNIDDLIAAWMNDEAAPDDARRLFEWVRANPENAKYFAQATSFHTDLHTYFSGARSIRDAGEEPFVAVDEKSSRPVNRTSQARQWYVSATASACVLLIVGLSLLFVHVEPVADKPVPTVQPFVTVAQVVDAEWGNETSPAVGDRIAAETLVLTSGIARLIFDDGVEVTIQGPSRLDLISKGATKLAAGTLTATVPPGAIGFRVETPSVEVFDLGTAFGVSVTEAGDSHIAVFDGEVQVFPTTGSHGQLLAAGEEVRVAARPNIGPGPFDSRAFEQLWPVSSGIVNATGAVHFASPWTGASDSSESVDRVAVQPEGYATILSGPLNVDVADAGEYSRASQLDDTNLAAGARVRSFLLQFSPGDSGRQGDRIEGAVTFNRKILGLIVKDDQLVSSDARFSRRFRRDEQASRALALADDRSGDVVTISEDHRTVSLSLAPGDRLAGDVRVIVDDSYAEIPDVKTALANIGADDTRQAAVETSKSPDESPADAGAPRPPAGFGPGMHRGPIRFLRFHDADGDGKLSRDEIPRHMLRMWHRMDIDGDGFATEEELRNRPMRPPQGFRPGPPPGR